MNVVKMQILGSHPRTTQSENQGVGVGVEPVICAFGDSHVGSNLRTTVLKNHASSTLWQPRLISLPAKLCDSKHLMP